MKALMFVVCMFSLFHDACVSGESGQEEAAAFGFEHVGTDKSSYGDDVVTLDAYRNQVENLEIHVRRVNGEVKTYGVREINAAAQNKNIFYGNVNEDGVLIKTVCGHNDPRYVVKIYSMLESRLREDVDGGKDDGKGVDFAREFVHVIKDKQVLLILEVTGHECSFVTRKTKAKLLE